MTKRAFRKLCSERWRDVVHVFPEVRGHSIPVEFGHFEHFDTPRGFGVTFCMEQPRRCAMRYPKKILRQPESRVDGVVRHEMGHVVDHLVPRRIVNQRGLGRGVRIPPTDERRADAIAWAIWGMPVRYDRELVQNTLEGEHPRPRHLGL